MVKKRTALYAAACAIALALAAFFLLEPALNSRYIKLQIAAFIEKKTGAVLAPDQMVFTVFPHPGMRLTAADLPLTRAMGLQINAMQIQLDMGQILRGRVMVSKIMLEDLDVWFTPAPDSEDTQQTFHDTFLVQFPQKQVNQVFALFADNQKEITLVLKNKKSDFFQSLDGTLKISKSEQTMVFNTRIQDLHIKKKDMPLLFSLENFPLNTLESPGAHLQIQLDARSGFTGNLTMAQFLITSDQLPDKAITGSKIACEFGFSQGLLFFDLAPVQMDYPDARVSVNFADERSRQKTALTFTGNTIDIAQAREASLAMAPENQVVLQLFDILRQGTASSISVAFHGDSVNTLFDGKKMVLEGTAENAVVKIPETRLMAADVAGSARVTQGVLEITAARGQVKHSHIRQGQLAIDLMNHQDIGFKGTFDLDVDLSEVPGILIPLLPETMLATELARVRRIQGRVDTRLDLGMAPGQKDVTVMVSADPFSGTGYYDRIPFPVTISSGRFQYSEDRVLLTGFAGRIGTNPFTGVSAQVDFSRNALVTLSAKTFDLNIADMLSWEPLLPTLKTYMGPVEHLQGQLKFDQIHFTGPAFAPDQWAWKLFGEGSEIQAGFFQDTREIQHGSGRFAISEKTVSVENIKAVFTDLHWLSRALGPDLAASITVPLSLEKGKVDISATSAAMDGQLTFPANAGLSIQLSGNTLQDLKPQMVKLKHGADTDASVMFDWHKDPPIFLFEGKLNTRTLSDMVKKNSKFHKHLTAVTGGVPMIFFTKNNFILQVDTPQLHLEPLLPAIDGIKTKPSVLMPAHKSLRLQADRLAYGKYSFADIKAVIGFDRHVKEIQLDSAELCGLAISGSVRREPGQTLSEARFHATIQAMEQQDITPALSCLFPDLNLMDGAYSFAAHLTGKGFSSADKDNVNGRISFSSHNGRIHKMTLLSRLLSVLNILKLPDITQHGFRYRSVLVEARVEKGVIHLEKAVIDAENMALFFSGQIFPFGNKLNLTCLVAPFKTIDTIIKYIPMINTILSGRLASFPAKATGAINDPVITPLHPSAVGEGIMNLFMDIMKSPARLLESIP
ncbi:MAG: AsmA-like C-terminal domain-containing protein [Desulfotignum sp.]|jgi:hypothetical protein|nr:AsmA-like C-terminal domain-containing protein [Desulfotignum sp.]